MNPDTIRLGLLTIAGAGGLVWLLGLLALLVARTWGLADDSGLVTGERDAHAAVLRGGFEVVGPADRIRKRAALAFGGDSGGPLGLRLVDDQSPGRLRLESVALPEPNTPEPKPRIQRAEFRFEPTTASRTLVTYRLEIDPSLATFAWGAGFQAAGLIVLAVGFLASWSVAGSNYHDHIQAQALQLAQVVHLLWPPFLAASLIHSRRERLIRRIEILLYDLAERHHP